MCVCAETGLVAKEKLVAYEVEYFLFTCIDLPDSDVKLDLFFVRAVRILDCTRWLLPFFTGWERTDCSRDLGWGQDWLSPFK